MFDETAEIDKYGKYDSHLNWHYDKIYYHNAMNVFIWICSAKKDSINHFRCIIAIALKQIAD